MQVQTLRNYLNRLPKEFDDKEITFYDYKTNKAYQTKEYVYVVDETDPNWLDFIFNYED